MQAEFKDISGRIGIAAAVVLVLAALGLYLYSERAIPPETETDLPAEAESGSERLGRPLPEPTRQPPVGSEAADPGGSGGLAVPARQPGASAAAEAEDGSDDAPTPEVSLELQHQRLREDLALRLEPGQIDMVADEQLMERLVTTLNSLDGAPVPLRFRPLAHVPGLPRLAGNDDQRRLPENPDPRYRPYRAMFDRLDAVEMAELFDRYEPALEKAWQALGEKSGPTFRQRAIEILEHLAEFELPAARPALHQPKVLYEYIDPALEQLSWGRKILVRIGPEHAPQVQGKLAALAELLARRSR